MNSFPVGAKNSILKKVIDKFPPSRRGRPRSFSVVSILHAIFYVLKTGCQWRSLQYDGISPMTVYHYFRLWSKARIFEDTFYCYPIKKNTQGIVTDTTFVKNIFGQDNCGRNPTDRGRKATKVSLITNEAGDPLSCTFHPANKADCTILRHTLDEFYRKRSAKTYSCIHADKGYDSQTCRSVAAKYDLVSQITRRGMQDSGKVRYVVEQTFGLLDRFRRILVRYDSKMYMFKSFWYFGCLVVLARR
jgi:transposase